MFSYEGLSCPVCSKLFTAEDDVVVCPQCGLPHHRSCWKSIGKCFEDDKHGTEQQWSRQRAEREDAPHQAQSVMHACPHCGTQNAEYAEFCTRCGFPLDVEDWHSAPRQSASFAGEYTPFGQPYVSYSSEERIGASNAADLSAVVGNNANYYMERFRRIERGGAGGWNWSAFVLAPVWLFYRKQYVLGAIYLVMQLMADITSSVACMPINSPTVTEEALAEVMSTPMFLFAVILSYIVLALRILLGIRANHFYLQHCEKRITKAKVSVPNMSAAELTSIGGVSVGAAVGVAVLIYTVVPILLETVLIFVGVAST